MNTFFNALFQDPIMIAAVLVLAGTLAILLWAVKSLNDGSAAPEELAYEDIPQAPHRQNDENSGLTEARLQAIVNQLNDISQRLESIEKSVKNAKPSDQTIKMSVSPDKIEENIKRLESKIDAMSSVKITPSAGTPDISAIETKLEGIHKLLIYLTDSGK